MADTNTYISKQKVEKWTTKEKFDALGDLRDIEPGTEYNLTGAIDETDLGSALQTKINGKLTAPATPTAESAVTMLADGTVGTKPLSEIGGKLHSHMFSISGDNGILSGVVPTSKGTSYTENELYLFLEKLTNHYNSYTSFGYASGTFISNGQVLFTEIKFGSNDSGQKILTGAYVYQLSSEGTIVKTAITNPTFNGDIVTDL